MSFKFSPGCCCSGYQCGQTYGPQTIKTADIQAYCDAMQNMVGDPRDQWFQAFIYNDESEGYRSGYYDSDGSLPDTALKDYADAGDIMLAAFQNCKRIRIAPRTIGISILPFTYFTFEDSQGSHVIVPDGGGRPTAYFTLILHPITTIDLTQYTRDHGLPAPIKLISYVPESYDNYERFIVSSYGGGNRGSICAALQNELRRRLGTTEYTWYFDRVSGGSWNSTRNSWVYLNSQPTDPDGDFVIDLTMNTWNLRLSLLPNASYQTPITQDQIDSFVSDYNNDPINLLDLPLGPYENRQMSMERYVTVKYWGAENVWGQ